MDWYNLFSVARSVLAAPWNRHMISRSFYCDCHCLIYIFYLAGPGGKCMWKGDVYVWFIFLDIYSLYSYCMVVPVYYI